MRNEENTATICKSKTTSFFFFFLSEVILIAQKMLQFYHNYPM